MKYSFITIEREYGSAGTKIAQTLAKECGVPCYGREILEEVSSAYKIPVEKIEKYEENVTNSFLYSLIVMSRVRNMDIDLRANEELIYAAEQKIIRNFASKGSCVFLGHCASEALNDMRGVVKVFIRASSEEKRKRIAADYNIPENEIENVRKRFDKKRANYYYANTGKKWDDFRNYDIVLDSSSLGINGCVAALKGLFERNA